MAVRNVFYAQSVGVTAVINATECELILEARRHPERIGKVLAGCDGIIGALSEELFDTSLESDADIARLRSTSPSRAKNAVMPTVRRFADAPCRREIGDAPLKDIANAERKMPAEFISGDGFHVTNACRTCLRPLIEGEDLPPFGNGLPDHVRVKTVTVPKRRGPFSI